MKMYRSVKNSSVIAQVVKEEDNHVYLDVEGEDGQRVIAQSTFHRWWRGFEVEETVPEVEQAITEVTATEEVTPGTTEFVRETFKNNKCEDVHNNFYDFIEKMQQELNIEIFKTQTKGFYYLKTMGRIYFPFTLSPKKGVILWVKSKAVEGIHEYEKVNHNFDGRITVSEWNMETYKLIVKLHDTSLKYTRDKITKK